MDELWNNAPCGVVLFNDEGELLEMNATLLRLLSIPNANRPRKFTDLLTVACQIFHQTHFFPLLRLHGKADEIFLTMRAHTGETIPMLAFAVRRNEVTQCVLVPVQERQKYEQEILAAKRAAEDAVRNNNELIDAKKQVEQQSDELERRIRKSEQSNRELVQVTDILFHDLREPIRKIETFSELLESPGQFNNDTPRAIATIQSACRRMQQLLRALQEFVSVENQNEPVELVDLNTIAHQTYSNVSRCYPDIDAEFVVEPLPSIEGHARQLSLLFTNLFDNAFKFRDVQSRLKIEVTGTVTEENRFQAITGRYRYVSYAQLTVSDNGKGIAEEYRNSIFDLLKKLDPANPDPGCGLAICKKVVENHYGTISVYPIAKHGTTFKILLPMQYDRDVTHKQTA